MSNQTGRRLLSFDVQHVRPRARGTLRLASRNPFDVPLIDPNYLGNAQDMNAIVEGIKTVLTRITNIGPFSRNTKLLPPVPGCTSSPCYGGDQFCDQYIRCFVRQTSVAVFRQGMLKLNYKNYKADLYIFSWNLSLWICD